MLRQPMLIGYIITGILVGPSVWNLITATDTVTILSQFGVALLLFMVGLSLNPNMIKDLGKISVYAGLGQIIFTAIIGFFLATWLGFTMIPALYLAIAITFSSTIIIMKLLSDKGDLYSLYGRIAVGVLLVQDLVAVFLLMIISSTSSGLAVSMVLFQALLTGVGLIALLFIISKYILPLIDGHLSSSIELLFLCSIAWCLAWAAIFQWLGFSIEIGALLAGVALSITEYGPQISARIRPLRDFFVVLFFILLGSTLEFNTLTSQGINAAIVLSIFVLLGNPFIIMIVMRLLKFPPHAGFLVGLTAAQISEFSLIIVALGVKLNHIEPNIMTVITIIALTTIGISSYMISYSKKLYSLVAPYLNFLEPKNISSSAKKKKQKSYNTILFGYNRIGYDLTKPMEQLKGSMLVIDYNPEVVYELQQENINCMYGDVEDVTLFDNVNLKKPKLFVSTIPDFGTNISIIANIRKVNKKAIIIVIAHQIKDALQLYEQGASFVLLPHFIGGKHAAHMIKKFRTTKKYYDVQKRKQVKELKDRLSKGHEHPKHENLR